MRVSAYSFEGQEKLPSPQLVIYPEQIQRNIEKMIEIAGTPQRLWPHMKTHKSAHVLEMQIRAGITRVKCATIAEAEVAASCGCTHVALAYPVVGPNIERFLLLCRTFPNTVFYAIADNTQQAELLGAAAVHQGMEAHLLMDMDMGQHRTGVLPELAGAYYRNWAKMPGVRMCGMHCYDGHVHMSDLAERTRMVCQADSAALAVKAELTKDGYDCAIMLMGGTPSFPIHAAFTAECLSPGTCVIQDAGYMEAYPDMPFDPAAAVLTRVISRPSQDTFTVDLGTKAVASDPAPERARIVGMPFVTTLLQNEEHWVLRVPREHRDEIPPIGAALFAIPTHVCPTTILYPEFAVVQHGRLTGFWSVDARNRKITI